MDVPDLPKALQAFLQILMARKVMSDDDAQTALEASYDRFGDAGFDLNAALSHVERSLNLMEMGVRSVKVAGASSTLHHCLVNKASDEIAKLHGSKLTPWQIDVFKGIVAMYADRGVDRVTLMDLEELRDKHKNVNKDTLRSFAEQLVTDFWLSRPDNSHGYALGIRSYVELAELLKSYDLTVPQVLYH